MSIRLSKRLIVWITQKRSEQEKAAVVAKFYIRQVTGLFF